MFVSSTPKRAMLWYASSDATTLIIECAAAENSGILEIGNKHIYASRKNRSLIGKRQDCGLQVRIKRKSSVREEAAAKLDLSQDKIGYLCFCPPSEGDELTSAMPASLEATLFLEDQLFDSLLTTFQSGKTADSIRLDIDSKETLRYGWEPDGSRIEWRIENTSDPAYVNVASVALGLELFRT